MSFYLTMAKGISGSMKRIMIVTGILIAASIGSIMAQPPLNEPHQRNRMPVVAPFGPPHRGGGENMSPMVLDVIELQALLTEIGITKPTIEKAVAIVRSFLAEFEGKLIRVQREELGIREELLGEKPDLKAVRNCVNRKALIFAEIEFAQIKRDVDIRALLTPDEYDRWKAAMKKKMQEMMPPGMGGEGPGCDSKGPAQPKRRQ